MRKDKSKCSLNRATEIGRYFEKLLQPNDPKVVKASTKDRQVFRLQVCYKLSAESRRASKHFSLA